MSAGALPERAAALLDFWFGPPGDPARQLRRDIWFRSTPEYDAAVRLNFLADHEAAAAGRLVGWENTAAAALALVLLLDQVPRNIFRGTPRAYGTDEIARSVTDRALKRRFDLALPVVWRKFFYLPFEHSERLEDQRRSVLLFEALPKESEPAESIRIARRHCEIVERFGRFPHRNRLLGRETSAAEAEFLKEPDSSF